MTTTESTSILWVKEVFNIEGGRRRDQAGCLPSIRLPLYGHALYQVIKALVNTIHDNLMAAIGPLHDPITWYRINYAGTQVAQWDFKNKGKSGCTGTSSFVLEVPLCNLRPSIIYSVPFDRILQRAYLLLV